MTTLDREPLDAAFMQDPHQLYDRLRADAPVHRVLLPRGTEAWLVTRHADARAALSDPRLAKSAAGVHAAYAKQASATGIPMEFSTSLSAHMLNSDPPDHTRLRTLVNKAFTARAVESLRPRVQAIAAGLVAAIDDGAETDLLDALAFPLPITVIGELLGVPEADRERFRDWSNVIVSAGVQQDVHGAVVAMSEYLAVLVAAKRADPGEDMLSALVTARDADDRLSEKELVSMAFLLLVAGHETTVNLIGNGMLALLRNPEQLAALRADPALLPKAIEEFLRYEGPVNLATLRYTAQEVRIGEVTVPEGEIVMVSLGAANRDGARFADADALDITRPGGGHLAFGHGIHYCVGAPLARMEAELAFGALLGRFGHVELAAPAEDLRWRESTLMRGLEALPVRVRATG